MSLSTFFGRGTKTTSASSIDDKKPLFLEPGSLVIYHTVAGKLHHLSKLPPKTDIHEWLATNSLAFFNHVNVQVGAISELCTPQSCATMTAGKETFEWLDDRKVSKKMTRVPAKQFIDTALSQIQKQLRDESIFPTKFGYDFPVEFITIVRKIFRTYFAILAHIYYHHFSSMHRLGLHDGLNTLLLHFIYFINEFSLMEPKEYQCLEELISKLMQVEQELAKNPPIDELRSLGIHDHHVHATQPVLGSKSNASSNSSKSNHT